MKLIAYVLMSSMLALLPSFAVAKSDPDSEINVTAQHLTLAKWSARTGQQLSRKLTYPDIVSGPREGVVAVKFACSDSGAPTGVALLTSSGSRQLDAAAMRGVARIQTLHPLPDGLAPSQKYVATVLFANDQSSYFRQIRALRDAEQAHNQRFAGRSSSLAMGASGGGTGIALLNDDGSITALN